ncbi:amino acid adenylation domain-containing protein, partial [Pleionea sp. CnH1-48]|uniref:non-ribosomal peptide synthetase n=1 Tax=Pleionea sp. CnH1-48 TaxID=2954494 RepID=UPI00209837E6
LAPLSVQYMDYAHWQREWLSGEVLEQQLGYWQTQLEDVPVVHNLPLNHKRPNKKSYEGGRVNAELSAELMAALKEKAQQQGITLFMLVHATLALLVARYSHRDDVVIGTPVANRMQKEVEPLIGFFVNTLALRTSTAFESVDGFLSHVREVHLGAQQHQDIPFDVIVEHCQIERSLQFAPLVQIMLSMDSNEQSDLSLDEVQFSALSNDEVYCKFDLELNVESRDDGLGLQWIYDVALFDEDFIQRFNQHFVRLLQNVVLPDVGQIPQWSMFSAEEMSRLVEQPSLAYECRDSSLVARFQRMAANYPEQVAVCYQDEEITYRALEHLSDRIGGYLQQEGSVEAGQCVGLCVSRSIDMIAAMLGILKVGAAYVPLDAKYPKERLDYMIKEADLSVIITDKEQASTLSGDGAMLLSLDGLSDMDVAMTLEPSVESTAESLAYINFTSGSTGLPKGVMVAHKSVLRLVSAPNFMDLNAQTRFLQSSSVSFDAATLEIWGALLNGGCLVLYPDDYLDLNRLDEVLSRYQVTAMWLTAGLFEQWSERALASSSLEYVLAGGDVLSPLAVHQVKQKAPQLTVINGYGPTENTTFSSCYVVDALPEPDVELPIGHCVQGSSAFVVSKDGSLAPYGAEGELLVGGDGVALGYLKQADLTAERFIENPFGAGRLYRTGDVVRYLPNGALAYLGREDDQVKVRGFRIELGEVQHQVLQQPGVKSAVVLAEGAGSGDKVLRAYVVLEDGVDSDSALAQLKSGLEQCLPDYMMPSVFVLLSAF